MKKVRKLLLRYKFFLILLVLNTIVMFIDPNVGKEIFSLSFDSLVEMLSIIPPIFLLLGLMDVWIPKELMMKYMGKDAGIKGGIFAFILGSFSAGPLYASFPIAAVFLNKGVSLINIFLFIGSWSTAKIPMMLFEVSQLGVKFTFARYFLNLAGIILLAIIMEKTTDKEEADLIYEKAASQLNGKKDPP